MSTKRYTNKICSSTPVCAHPESAQLNDVKIKAGVEQGEIGFNLYAADGDNRCGTWLSPLYDESILDESEYALCTYGSLTH